VTVGAILRARFGTTRHPWCEQVVTGTKAGFSRHSRLSSRISRSTLLWFTAKPARRSCAEALNLGLQQPADKSYATA